MPPARLLLLLLLAGCGNDYSADTYATRQGTTLAISADGQTGAAVGAAAGGVVGAATPGSNLTSALAGVGGGLVGGLFGTATERALNDNRGTEYIVRQTDGKLVRVTQRDVPPLPIGQKVLVIAGAQARIVADYTVPGAGPGAGPATAGSPVQAPVRADPPSAAPQPPAEAPTRTELPPVAPPPSPRAPLVPPEAPLAL